VPTLGWVEQLCLSALLKGQHPFWMFSFEQFEFVESESGTAGPSAPLGMTNFLRISQEICRRRDLYRPGRRIQAEENLVELTGIEPVTPCLQSRCSPS
jgi:hypothetical protein